jgi:thiamine biosynthesis protein ThiS
MIRVGDVQVEWQEGLTVTELLAKLDESHAYAVVRINNRYISRPHFDTTLVPDNSEIYLIPMIAGG